MMKQSAALMIPLLALVVFGSAIPVNAQVTANSCSYTDVQNAVNSVARGSSVTVPAGSCTWGSSVNLTKGIILTGAGVGNTIITSTAGAMIAIAGDSTVLANQEMIKVNGFTFDGGGSATTFISVTGGSSSDSSPTGATKVWQKLVIGDNKFQHGASDSAGSADINVHGQVRGVIYHNTFENTDRPIKSMGFNTSNNFTEWADLKGALAFGTVDNIYFEDNTIDWTISGSRGNPGWVEVGQSGRISMRYNTWNLANVTNASSSELWDIHGSQNNPGGQDSTMLIEDYGNTLLNTAEYRWIYDRGGWNLYFDNIGGGGGMGVEVANYPGSCDSTTGQPTELRNTYFWNNTAGGSEHGAGINQDACGTLVENSRFWNYNGSCTASSCSAGIGRGTSAPTGTCTTGVGYWVASTATPTTSSSVIQNAHFYKCTATNTWTLYYVPYTYPHPLRTGSPPVQTGSQPFPPTNLRAVIQ